MNQPDLENGRIRDSVAADRGTSRDLKRTESGPTYDTRSTPVSYSNSPAAAAAGGGGRGAADNLTSNTTHHHGKPQDNTFTFPYAVTTSNGHAADSTGFAQPPPPPLIRPSIQPVQATRTHPGIEGSSGIAQRRIDSGIAHSSSAPVLSGQQTSFGPLSHPIHPASAYPGSTFGGFNSTGHRGYSSVHHHAMRPPPLQLSTSSPSGSSSLQTPDCMVAGQSPSHPFGSTGPGPMMLHQPPPPPQHTTSLPSVPLRMASQPSQVPPYSYSHPYHTHQRPPISPHPYVLSTPSPLMNGSQGYADTSSSHHTPASTTYSFPTNSYTSHSSSMTYQGSLASRNTPLPDRPFKCDECVQSFNRNHDLKRHKRIHLAVKPFACEECSKQFSRKDALRRHWLVKGCRTSDDPNANMSNREFFIDSTVC